MVKTCIHYCDVNFTEGTTCSIKDRVNDLTYCIQLESDEKKDVKKCKYAAIVFLKYKPEECEVKVKKVKSLYRSS